MAVFWNLGADPPLILRRDDRCRASAAALRGRDGPQSVAEVCRPVRRCSDANASPPQNRGNGLKSQIKSAMTWHYIFSKSPARANNINNLLDALGQQLLKISQSTKEQETLAAIGDQACLCPASVMSGRRPIETEQVTAMGLNMDRRRSPPWEPARSHPRP